MGIFTEYAINGLQAGLLLFIVSAGLTLCFGLMRVINMAHGSFYMVGAFLGLQVSVMTGSFVLGLLGAAIGSALVGLTVERTLFQRIYSRGPFAQVLVSFGLIFVFDELVRIIWGGEIRSLSRPEYLSEAYQIAGAWVESYRLFLIAFGGVLSGLLLWGLVKTPFGLMIRAAVDDRESAELLGVNVRQLFSVVFLIGASVAGMAGFVAIPLVNAFPGMGDDVLISALIVVVMGGLGSVTGSLLASLVIGFGLTIGQVFMAGYAPAVMYVILGLVLLARPNGLLGKPE
ncbi:branched-chain amino acid ABC transporter permease [Hydrogenophaga sp.]|uniref:branched-chain amino acid ABC transporter permease n=1 Tax=Hydrogenophaga sp. TaxID=1904254 RepID=UPI0035613C61